MSRKNPDQSGMFEHESCFGRKINREPGGDEAWRGGEERPAGTRQQLPR